MSTRARIGIVSPKTGVITSIYTHSDGYVSHHGPLLLNHYTDPATIRKLLKFGDRSWLGEEPTADGSYPERAERDEDGVHPRKNNTVHNFYELARGCNAEYAYLFDNGQWVVSEVCRTLPPEWKNLALEAVKERMTA